MSTGGGAGAGGAGLPPEEGLTPEQQRYLLYLVDGDVYAIAEDGDYVYWNRGGRLMRGLKSGSGESEVILDCASCDSILNFAADGGYVYWLGPSFVLKVDGADKTSTEVPLLWDHLHRGALLVDQDYIYTAMPGCAAITRIDKETLAFDSEIDVMQIESEFPYSSGATLLARTSGGLLCGAPGWGAVRVFLIEEWGSSEELLQGGGSQWLPLWALASIGDDAYWMHQGENGSGIETAIGRVSLGGDEPTLFSVGGTAGRMLLAPSLGRFVWGADRAIRSFDVMALAAQSDLSLGSGVGVGDIASDGQAFYAAASRIRTGATTSSGTTQEYAGWIAKIPVEQLLGTE